MIMNLSPKLKKIAVFSLAAVTLFSTGASQMTNPAVNARRRTRTHRVIHHRRGRHVRRRARRIYLTGGRVINGVRTFNEHGSALNPYKAKFSYVHNRDLFRPKFTYNRSNSLKTPVTYWKGTPQYSFRPYFQFNINTDPQSIVIEPNGTMLVLYSDEDGYDNIVRMPLHSNLNQTPGKTVGQIGPASKLGHGQTLAYNPHDNTLWMLTNKSGYRKYTSAVEINRKTLKPEYRINFKFSNNTKIGDDLTFDKDGHAYSCVKTKKNNLEIFEGKVSRKGVHFHLIHQLVLHAPGQILQGMDYNPANNRIYVISDGAIMSFPANRTGRLSPRSVRDTIFKQHREFEGVGFYKNRGYLLVNSPEAVLKSTAHM